MKKIALILCALLLAAPAEAKDWTVDYAHSKIGFTGDQSGATFNGGFKKFTAQISLDPDQPETGKISVTVDIASAYAGDADRDSMLPQKDWFNVAQFPQATFTATAIKKTGPWKFEADGVLTIKGISRDIKLPFTLAPDTGGGGRWVAQGKTDLMRNDFGVGLGMFSGENYVKNAVTVTVDIVATPP